MDSSGLTALVVARNRLEAGGGSLSVASPTEPVARLLELTGLAFLIGDDDG
jgi:anti-anti-sigma factor